MNKELATVLRDKLVGLPFIDVLAGLAQTVTEDQMAGGLDDGAATKTTKKYPVSYDCLGVDCQGKEIPLWPDSSKKSLIYFEDFGVTSTGRLHGQSSFNSSIRLVCWLNRANLVGNHYQEIGGRIMATIIDTLAGRIENLGMFIRLTCDVVKILPQDSGVFTRYTYKEQDRQYLRPPFEFFAIDLTCKYQVPAKCLSGINWNLDKCT